MMNFKWEVLFANPDTTDDVQREIATGKDLATIEDIYSEYRVVSIEPYYPELVALAVDSNISSVDSAYLNHTPN